MVQVRMVRVPDVEAATVRYMPPPDAHALKGHLFAMLLKHSWWNPQMFKSNLYLDLLYE